MSVRWAMAGVAAAVACRSPGSIPPVPPAAPIEAGAVEVPASEPVPVHPGSIVFVDLDSREERALPLADVPESIAWGVMDGRRVPVVRVESRVRGGSREIVRYAEGGVLVDATVAGP